MKLLLQKCLAPDCNNSFKPKQNKKFCCPACKNNFHNMVNADEVNANNREIAKLKKAGKTLAALDKKMSELNMSSISLEALHLFNVPIYASTDTSKNQITNGIIYWYMNYGLEAANIHATKFFIHKRDLCEETSLQRVYQLPNGSARLGT